MLTIPHPKSAAILAIAFAASSLVRAEDPAALQKKLESKYALTTINAEGGVVTQGVTLTLKKPGLMAGAKSCTLEYKGGIFALVGSAKASCTVGKASGGFLGGMARSRIPGLGSAPDAQAARLFVPGEKVWVTKITVTADVVGFTLVSDTINSVVYNAVVRFQPQPGATPDLAQTDLTLSDAFTVTPADSAQGAAPAASTGVGPAPVSGGAQAPITPPAPPAAPAQDKLADIAPPPPPPDQAAPAPQTVSMGQSIDQVVAILGQPTTSFDGGPKKIYTYKSLGLKVTFVDGKVTDVQ